MIALRFKPLLACACLCAASSAAAGDLDQIRAVTAMDRAVAPLMRRYAIPGMAVGVVAGEARALRYYGVVSKAGAQPVDADTLFEIGSVSKTLTATLAAWAQASGKLDWADATSAHVPELRGSAFDRVSVLHLATHTHGGLPLQVPAGIADKAQLFDWLGRWRPAFAPGTQRVYSNPGIGLLGVVAARSLQVPYEDALARQLLPALGLARTWLHVPAREMRHYAQGYTRAGAPVRVNPGVLDSETYGIKTGAPDLLRFVEAQMGMVAVDANWQRAIDATHAGYYSAGALTQDLVWEQYPYPVDLRRVLAGNADAMIYQPAPATALTPPLPPQTAVLINKTGSTNGFAAYVAFVPENKIGIVMLANRNYPIEARVHAALNIMAALETGKEKRQ